MNLTMMIAVCWLGIAAGPGDLRSSDAGPVDFDTQVMPLLTQAGCNAAACHGAAAGRGDFKLSLFGGDPEADYEAIVHEREGRRVNLAVAAESLLVAKPTMQIDHGGDFRFDAESDAARLLESWIREGAERRRGRRLEQLVVEPVEAFQPVGAEPLRLRVTASFARINVNGGIATGEEEGVLPGGSEVVASERPIDVTRWVVFEPTDTAALDVDENGAIVALRPGLHTVIVRYLNRVAAVRVITPFPQTARTATGHRQADQPHWIDEEIDRLLATLNVSAAPQASDAAMIRRVTLDLTGRLPDEAATRDYLADRSTDKYERLVNRLLDSPEFVEYWTHRIGALLRIRSSPGDHVAAAAFHRWIQERVSADAPWDETARALVAAMGDSHETSPAYFHRLANGAREEAEYFSETLLGVRLRCANCHDHPLDRWTQDDYHGLAAIFAKLDRARIVRRLDRGEVIHPATGAAARPKLPGVASTDSMRIDERDDVQRLAEWLTDGRNEWFATAMANRLWQSMFGRGLVEPADDLRATNPASHPKLLDRLTEEFVASGYRIRPLLRSIALTNAYRRAGRVGEETRVDEGVSLGMSVRLFGSAAERPLAAEVLLDAIADATGIPDSFPGQPFGVRAVTLVDPRSEPAALELLGRCSRDQSCEASGRPVPGIAQRLHLLNGELLNDRVQAKDGWLHRRLADSPSPRELVRDVYFRCLSREPDAGELRYWTNAIDREPAAARAELVEDFFWSILAGREFSTNH